MWGVGNPEITIKLYKNPELILPFLIYQFGLVKVIFGLLGLIAIIILSIIFVSKNEKFVYLRGTKLVSTRQLKTILRQESKPKYAPQLEIAGLPIPEKYENRGFFFVGSPGSGKTQAIKQIVAAMKQRPDFRGIILDRGGEMLESFYDPKLDVIYNPFDVRSCNWSHIYEPVRPETLAAGLIPIPASGNQFFANGGRVIIAEIFRKTQNNAEVYELLRGDPQVLSSFLANTLAARYLEEDKARTSVLSTLNNYCQFYASLTECRNKGLSFYNWAESNSPRWIFITLKENDAELLKPLHSLIFELMLKGLLSNTKRTRKTAIIIDELGALNQLPSLDRLLSEGRKYNGCPFLGTQSDSQLIDIYGQFKTRTILQGLQSKVILRCIDKDTRNSMADEIGKQEVLLVSNSHSKSHSRNRVNQNFGQNEQVKERYVVMPAQLKLPDLKGYINFPDKDVAKIKIKHKTFPTRTQQFIELRS